MQPVGKLDDQHPDVARHCNHHFAHGLGLRGLTELYAVELGDPVNQKRNLLAKITSQRLQRVVGVFDGVVQQRGGNGRRPAAKVCENLCHSKRMRDVRLARFA